MLAMSTTMGKIARDVHSGRFPDALELMRALWDGDAAAAAYALREVFDVDVEKQFPSLTPRLP